MVGTLGRKPSDSHVVWTNREEIGEGRKRFDFEYLELWAANFGVDYETHKRVDHERSDEPRRQHLVVFDWEQSGGETLEMGDRTWEMGGGETPRTFVEIDDAGEAKVRSWKFEAVVDVWELWIEGPVMRMVTADHGQRDLDTRNLLPEGSPES